MCLKDVIRLEVDATGRARLLQFMEINGTGQRWDPPAPPCGGHQAAEDHL